MAPPLWKAVKKAKREKEAFHFASDRQSVHIVCTALSQSLHYLSLTYERLCKAQTTLCLFSSSSLKSALPYSLAFRRPGCYSFTSLPYAVRRSAISLARDIQKI